MAVKNRKEIFLPFFHQMDAIDDADGGMFIRQQLCGNLIAKTLA
jgi:hypothetical protein